MEIEFLKMQGCGEDAVLMDCFKQPKPRDAEVPRLARKILDRRCGVGAESLLILHAGSGCRIAAQNLGPQGEEAPVSGNALRCVARYASDSGICLEKRFPVQTASGLITTQIIDSANVRVDMGVPRHLGDAGEIKERLQESFTRSLVAGGRSFTYTPVFLGVSFGVVFAAFSDFPFLRTVRAILTCPEYPQDSGVCFVQVNNREEIALRAWEKGAVHGTTKAMEEPASTAGAASSVVASVVNGFTDREVFVRCKGGDFFVQWEEADNRLTLTGPAAYAFTGTFYFEEEPEKEGG
jgi:diaminopimelate epimerase